MSVIDTKCSLQPLTMILGEVKDQINQHIWDY
jgi:hypothetical protein